MGRLALSSFFFHKTAVLRGALTAAAACKQAPVSAEQYPLLTCSSTLASNVAFNCSAVLLAVLLQCSLA